MPTHKAHSVELPFTLTKPRAGASVLVHSPNLTCGWLGERAGVITSVNRPGEEIHRQMQQAMMTGQAFHGFDPDKPDIIELSDGGNTHTQQSFPHQRITVNVVVFLDSVRDRNIIMRSRPSVGRAGGGDILVRAFSFLDIYEPREARDRPTKGVWCEWRHSTPVLSTPEESIGLAKEEGKTDA